MAKPRRTSVQQGTRSSVSERNCFSASFDGLRFQVRKWETGVPEGTHILAPHCKTRVSNLQTWKGLLLNERRNENPVLSLRAIWRRLRKLWQAARLPPLRRTAGSARQWEGRGILSSENNQRGNYTKDQSTGTLTHHLISRFCFYHGFTLRLQIVDLSFQRTTNDAK